MIPLSVIIPCFNEEAMIGDCLASAAFADDVVVVDSFSTDRTLEVAARHPARVLQHPFWSHGAQINWAIPQAKHDWILVVDADERVTPELAAEVGAVLRQPARNGYWIPRRNFFLGREIKHGMWGGDQTLRLFHRAHGRYQEKPVHSQVELPGEAGRCQGALLHYSYRSLDDYTRKVGRFARGGASAAFQRGKSCGPAGIFGHSLGRFLKSYLLKRGFLDGAEGLIIAFMEANHAFLKYSLLWEMGRKAPPPGIPGPAEGPARPGT